VERKGNWPSGTITPRSRKGGGSTEPCEGPHFFAWEEKEKTWSGNSQELKQFKGFYKFAGEVLTSREKISAGGGRGAIKGWVLP